MGKEPLILLPGTLCDERLWESQLNGLADVADITIGDTTKQSSIEGLAQDVLTKAPPKFSLAGLSLGGIVALEIMRISPDRVNKLALLSSNPFPPKAEQQQTWQKFIKMTENNQFIDITKEYLLPVLVNEENQSNQMVNTIIQMAENIGPKAYLNQLRAVMDREDQTSILSTITCPTLLMVGAKDVVCPITMTEYMKNIIPNSEMKTVENAGHLVTLEKSAEVTKTMRNWISS